MLVPGSNLLGIALGALGVQQVGYRAWVGQTQDAQGRPLPQFAPRVMLTGSMQPVSRDKIAFMGLEASKSYATLYVSAVGRPVGENRAEDRFDYAGRLYAVEGNVDWFTQDGWQGVLMVDVGPAT